MRAIHITWAEKHDWYRGASYKNGALTIRVYDNELNGLVFFTDLTKLKAWAGY